MVLCYERYYMKMPGLVRKAMGKIYRSPKLLNKMLLKRDAKNAANAAVNPGSFETKTQVPPEEGYDFSYHNLVCPLANFARQYGYEEYINNAGFGDSCAFADSDWNKQYQIKWT